MSDLIDTLKILQESAGQQRDEALYDRERQDAAVYFQGQYDILELVLEELKRPQNLGPGVKSGS